MKVVVAIAYECEYDEYDKNENIIFDYYYINIF
jgi:hypothetical protein